MEIYFWQYITKMMKTQYFFDFCVRFKDETDNIELVGGVVKRDTPHPQNTYVKEQFKTRIINIEKGGTSPTIDCLCKLAYALQADVHEIFNCCPEEDHQ